MRNIGKALSTLLLTPAFMMMMTGCGCSGSNKSDEDNQTPIKSVVKFNSDSAYSYVAKQVEFGPRVSGTEANEACSQYIVNELRRHGADSIREQRGTVKAYTGDRLPINNIMAAYNPAAKSRILLLAHYDTRPWSDGNPAQADYSTPIPGANDGGSGVGVLLEIARLLNIHKPPIGVDLLFVDAEDYGQLSGFSNHDESWALGTQYWAQHMPYAQDSLPRYAILLDMVGGIDAKFHREYFSNNNARDVVDRVWSVAQRSGYGHRFINVDGGAVVDDHVYVNKAGIPAINIIESKNEVTKSFPPTWHTLNDNMDNIDRGSLKAAGQTVINVIFNEKP
ncbi:MAG: M28 family peptidase [Duncaniella sp.]|nr:M28 family peptidase [Duncaniella sp.]